MVKLSEIETKMEHTALNAVRALLGRVPNIRVTMIRHEQHLASDYRFDSRIDFDHDGKRYALLIEIKSNGAPRFTRSAVYQLESRIAHLRRSAQQNATGQFIPMTA